MRVKDKILQGICLFVLSILIGICAFFFVKLRMDNSDGMNEAGLAIVFFLIVGIGLILYTSIYGVFYTKLLKGKNTLPFHQLNMKIVGFLFLAIIIFLIATRRIFFLLYLGPVGLLLLLLYLVSWSYQRSLILKK